MVKKKTNKKVNKKNTSSKKVSIISRIVNFYKTRKRPGVYIAFTLAIIFGLLFTVYKVSSIYYEKWQFNKAEQVLGEVSEEIAALVPGSEVKQENYCSYRSVKFENPGPPACSVGYYAHLPIENVNENIVSDIEKVFVDKPDISLKDSLIKNYRDGDEYSPDLITRSDFSIDSIGLDCYVNIFDYSESYTEHAPGMAKLTFKCSELDSTIQHFPVKN